MNLKNRIRFVTLGGLILLTVGWSDPAICSGQTQVSDNIFQLKEGDKPGKGRIADVAWLTGQWVGEGLGGEVDEVWSAAKHGHMSGTFRVFKDQKLLFSEYFTISEVDGSLELLLLHFDPRLVGWEEKGKPQRYRLVKVSGQTAYFDGLTYRLDDQGQLEAIVLTKSKDGQLQELKFQMKKM